MGLIIAIHVLVCFLLIIIILIQSGRGGGLVESFSGVESMFGTKTSAFLTRTTSVLSILFFLTCVGLAFLSAKQSKSLMQNIKTQEPVKSALPAENRTQESTLPKATQIPVAQDTAKQETPAQEATAASEAPKEEQKQIPPLQEAVTPTSDTPKPEQK